MGVSLTGVSLNGGGGADPSFEVISLITGESTAFVMDFDWDTFAEYEVSGTLAVVPTSTGAPEVRFRVAGVNQTGATYKTRSQRTASASGTWAGAASDTNTLIPLTVTPFNTAGLGVAQIRFRVAEPIAEPLGGKFSNNLRGEVMSNVGGGAEQLVIGAYFDSTSKIDGIVIIRSGGVGSSSAQLVLSGRRK
jgi:hypothetical protein